MWELVSVVAMLHALHTQSLFRLAMCVNAFVEVSVFAMLSDLVFHWSMWFIFEIQFVAAYSVLPPWAVLWGLLELEGGAGQRIPRQWPGRWGVHWACCHRVARSCRGKEGGGACTCLEEEVPGRWERKEGKRLGFISTGHAPLWQHQVTVHFNYHPNSTLNS